MILKDKQKIKDLQKKVNDINHVIRETDWWSGNYHILRELEIERTELNRQIVEE